MSKQKQDSKTTAKPNAAIAAANKTATKAFPKAKLRKAFDTIGAKTAAVESTQAEKQAAALDVCKLAAGFVTANDGIDVDTLVQGWRSNIKVLTKELAVAGNRFAELTEGKGDKPATAKLTGYGNNVASIAKGCIEYEIAPEDSYRATREAVEAARAESRRLEFPDEAALSDARSALDATWSSLRETVCKPRDTGLIDSMADTLAEIKVEFERAMDITQAMEDFASDSATDEQIALIAEHEAELREQEEASIREWEKDKVADEKQAEAA